MIVKAVAGGGGRGMRVVRTADEVAEAVERARSEAATAFGNGDVYVERLVEHARHIEVQIAGDAGGTVLSFGDRDCSIQRRHQKLIEIAPAPALDDSVRAALADAAVRMARAAGYRSLGTFEFLVETGPGGDGRFAFIEANGRLQVEHTVTEEVTGVDLVQLQLELAQGTTLAELGYTQATVPAPRGVAIQTRVNLETMRPDGSTQPSGGVLTAFEPPVGPGLRTDTFGYAGYATTPSFDSLLAKVITSTSKPDLATAARRSSAALGEFRIEGAATNIAFLRAVLHTRSSSTPPPTPASSTSTSASCSTPPGSSPTGRGPFAAEAPGRAGVRLDSTDPLAVLDLGKSEPAPTTSGSGPAEADLPSGTVAIRAPMQGTIVSIQSPPATRSSPVVRCW